MVGEAKRAPTKATATQNPAPGDVLEGPDFSMNDQEFEALRVVIKELTGINMGESKQQLVFRRVGSRLKATKIKTFSAYLKYLKEGDPEELEHFANAVTTNLTSFFRERHHFDFLENTIIPEIEASKATSGKRLRIWSAGCSTGEEPYSIAMTLQESLRGLATWDAKVLCTDLDSTVLDTCKAGKYSSQRVEKVPPQQLKRWFKKIRADNEDRYKVDALLTRILTFKQLNLMHKWPMRGKFDVIFCRNVIIYFDKPTQRVLIDRYADTMEDGGYLILGHSESLFNISDRFSLIGKTIYRKTS